jgi:hypothetical protein
MPAEDPAVGVVVMPSVTQTAGVSVIGRPGWVLSAQNAEIARQIEHVYPGCHVWISDGGWWYATRIRPWARGRSATVHGPGPRELTGVLAAEEAAAAGCVRAGAR